MMELLASWDILFLEISRTASLLAGARYFLKRTYSSSIQPDFPLLSSHVKDSKIAWKSTRSIKKILQQTGKKCVISYGSQTGTAEKYASQLAKDAGIRYDLQCFVADLDDYDYDDLDTLGSDHVAIFLMATYGEGEPTDNAIAFNHWVGLKQGKSSTIDLCYAAFGLGNSSYQFYNSAIRRVDTILSQSGATRIGNVGLGDDGKKTMEEDFNTWRIETLKAIAAHLNLHELPYNFKADFQITETQSAVAVDVFHGEPNKLHLRGKTQGPFTAKNPLPAKIVEARQLFQSGQRDCLHLEFDIDGTTLNYETGDHLAISPVNSDIAIDRFLRVFGLESKRCIVIETRSNDLSLKVPIPTLTTYEAAARYYLDIGAPVSRQLLSTIANLITNEFVQEQLTQLSQDVELFNRTIVAYRLELAQTLELIAPRAHFPEVPFSFLLENIVKLQPRYYSISSSSLVNRKRISITAVVDSVSYLETQYCFKGVNTNYLLALKQAHEGQTSLTHSISGPRGTFTSPTALIHVRKSNFRLPRSSTKPIIMIGPGTGVAPFRAFIQERALFASLGKGVGRTILFYGCRRSDQDFLYKDEWQQYQEKFSEGTFSIHTAFSREDEDKKVYVQDLLEDHAEELVELVLRQDAHIYVCGDASRMAKDVFRTFAWILDQECRRMNTLSGEEYLRMMRISKRWSEDVW